MTASFKTTILTVSEPDLLAYSRGLQASYGDTALSYAHQRAIDLTCCGDVEGADVWRKLAGLLETGSPKAS